MSDLYDVLNKQSKEKFHSTVIETLARRGVTARSMVAKPISEGSILPPYGTILRRKDGSERAMYLGRAADLDSTRPIPGNAMVILDDPDPYITTCTDMQMMKNWEIVEESKV